MLRLSNNPQNPDIYAYQIKPKAFRCRKHSRLIFHVSPDILYFVYIKSALSVYYRNIHVEQSQSLESAQEIAGSYLV